jgi:hypothetical protein
MYYPKASVCMVCEHMNRDCSLLPFESYAHKKAKPDDDGNIVVICREFVKK